MGLIYFISAIGFVVLIGFVGMMWYDRTHNYDW